MPGPGDEEKFKVTDRRAFQADGTARSEPEQPPGASPEGPEADAAPTAGEEIDFTTFLISLAANAMHHLGEGPEGAAGKPNLPLARQTIDIIGLLQHKTRGNLTGEEERLLDGVLYDLRMRFVAASKV